MASFYPHKPTVLIFIVCLLIILATALYSFVGNLPSKQQEQNNTLKIQVQNVAADISTTSISSNTDWKKQFSQSFFASSTVTSAGSATDGTDEDLTLTDQLGRSFFTHYVQLKQAGLLKQSDIVNTVTAQMAEVSLNSQSPSMYNIENLRITTGNDFESKKTYALAVSRALYMYTVQKNEAVIAKESLATQNAQLLNKIDPIIAIYKKMIAQLLLIPTPATYTQYMVELINGLSGMQFTAESFRQIDHDPMRGLIGASAYIKQLEKLMNALNTLENSLKIDGIRFDINPTLENTLFSVQ